MNEEGGEKMRNKGVYTIKGKKMARRCKIPCKSTNDCVDNA